jgi:hypothetical protein
VKNCTDWELLVEGNEYAATEVLIFALGMLNVGGKVTEKNAPEIFARLAAYEEHEGALRNGVGDDGVRVDVRFTPEEIQRRIGLSTNWGSRTESRAVWVKRVLSASTERALAGHAAEYRQAVA